MACVLVDGEVDWKEVLMVSATEFPCASTSCWELILQQL